MIKIKIKIKFDCNCINNLIYELHNLVKYYIDTL